MSRKPRKQRIQGLRGKMAPLAVKRYILETYLAGVSQQQIGAHVGVGQTAIAHFVMAQVERYGAQVDPALPLRGRRIFAIMLALAALPASGGVMASPAVAREAHAA